MAEELTQRIPSPVQCSTAAVWQCKRSYTPSINLPLRDQHVNFLHDVVAYIEKDWEYFQCNILPPCKLRDPVDSETLSSSIVRRCISNGIITNGRWQSFTQDPSKMRSGDSNMRETEVFKGIGVIWNQVVEAACSLLASDTIKSVLEFKYLPNNPGLSQRSGEMLRPDAIAYLQKSDQDLDLPTDKAFDWSRVACPMEFRRRKGRKVVVENVDEKENAVKAGMCATHIMADDLRRNAVYCVTIEDDLLRVWNYTRAGCIVSEPIKWLEDHEGFVGLIISLAFADRASLGYDPDIDMVWASDGHIQYNIRMKDPGSDAVFTYQTVGQPLRDYEANAPCGSATRIFRVIQILPTAMSEIMTFKISWNHATAVEEGLQLQSLRSSASNLGPSYDRVFMQPVRYGKFTSTDFFVRAKLQATSFYLESSSTLYKKRLSKNASGKKFDGRTGHHSSGVEQLLSSLSPTGVRSDFCGTAQEFSDRYYIPRYQYRILFRDVCQPLHDIENIQDYFLALSKTVTGVMYLHELGYVHRDLSTSAVQYVLDIDGRLMVKLTDLEYKRGIDTYEERGVVLTGFREFKAIEIQKRLYLFCDKPLSISTENALSDFTNSEIERISNVLLHGGDAGDSYEVPSKTNSCQNQPKNGRDIITQPVHNAIHDIESIYWMALWFLLNRVPKGMKLGSDRLQALLNASDRVFTMHESMYTPPPDRVDALITADGLKSILDCLPDQFRPVTAYLNLVRTMIKQMYILKETRKDWCGPLSMVGMLPVGFYHDAERIYALCAQGVATPVVPIHLSGTGKKRKKAQAGEARSAKKHQSPKPPQQEGEVRKRGFIEETNFSKNHSKASESLFF